MNHHEVVIIGAGQAGLVMGYYLKQAGISCILLESNLRIGDSWRNRYESLVLFTPRCYSSLPGLKMNGLPEGFPTKDEMANYLESYKETFDLPVKLNISIKKIYKNNNTFELVTNKGIITSKQVVVATGAFQKPFIPPVIIEKGKETLHIHSSDYISPSQISKSSVLVVGGGNSGAQIAVELAGERGVDLATSQPFKFLPLRILGKSIFKWFELVGLLYGGIDKQRGTWFRKQSDPIFGFELKKLISEGEIKIKERVIQVKGSEVTFQNKEKNEYETIIWATGFIPSYNFIKIDGAISSKGSPIQKRGISPIKGLFFIGLPWQYQRGSALICGVGRDAQYLVPFIREIK